MNITKEIKKTEKLFEASADRTKASQMAAYMKGLFSFYGIQKPLRTDITKASVKLYSKLPFEELKTLILTLWAKPKRELHYFAVDILYKAPLHKKSIDLFEKLILQKSWWDTVDNIAIRLVGPYFKKFPDARDKYIGKWRKGKNIWLVRTALLFQLKYKKETDLKLLFDLVRQHKDSDEFFIQKAIGWALREYTYIDPKIIKLFVNTNELKPLSTREALKNLK